MLFTANKAHLACLMLNMTLLYQPSAHAEPIAPPIKSNQEALEAVLRLGDTQSQPMQLLREAEALLKIDPNNVLALRNRFLALEKLGAAQLAIQLTPSSVLSPEESIAAQRKQLALELSWARVKSANIQQTSRWDDMDVVITKMEKLCNLDGQNGISANSDPASCGDLLVALSTRQQMTDAIALFQQMQEKKWNIEAYVQLSVAAAYLYNHQPDKAREMYAAALPNVPSVPYDLDAQIGYIYSLLESERYAEAYLKADQLRDRTKEWIDGDYLVVRKPNPDYVHAQITSALMRAYTDELDEAQLRLEQLAVKSPYNTDIKQTLASVYGMRGWHQRAEDDFEWIYSAEPESVDSKLGLFENRMELDDYQRAEQQLNSAVQQMPDEEHVVKAQREWANHNLNELDVEVTYGRNGQDIVGTTPSSSKETIIDTHLYSSPYQYIWRFFAHQQLATTVFLGQSIAQPATGGGVEYRVRDLTLTAEVLDIGMDGVGAAIDGLYRIDDYWSINGKIENKSLEAPLEAYLSNTTARNYEFGGKCRWNESRSIEASAGQMQFTDGNQRNSSYFGWNERLLNYPTYKLESSLEYDAERNSSQSALIGYYNPINGHTSNLKLQNEWIQYNRYEKSFKHVLTLEKGIYSEQSFPDGVTTNYLYEQSYHPNDLLELRYGIGYLEHPYDGVMFKQDYFHFQLKWNF